MKKNALLIIDMASTDIWLPKPRFSTFFNTGLEDILREQNVSGCAVAGITTHFCVLTTAMDALCHVKKNKKPRCA